MKRSFVLCLAAVFTAGKAHAIGIGQWTDDLSIRSVRYYTAEETIVQFTAAHGIDACSSSREAVLNTTSIGDGSNLDRIYSLIISGAFAGNSVAFVASACDAAGRPIIRSFRVNMQ